MSGPRGLEALFEVVATEIIRDALEISDRLRGMGVSHALIGGLAVGAHGYPRATKDVDYLVVSLLKSYLEEKAPHLVQRFIEVITTD